MKILKPLMLTGVTLEHRMDYLEQAIDAHAYLARHLNDNPELQRRHEHIVEKLKKDYRELVGREHVTFYLREDAFDKHDKS